jgi:hypothetical protein
LFSALGLHSEAFLGQVRDQKIQRKKKVANALRTKKKGKNSQESERKREPKKKSINFQPIQKFIS